MGGISKLAITLLLVTSVSWAHSMRVVESVNFGFVVLYNNGSELTTCFIQTNLGEFTLTIYPKDFSQPFRWIKIMECW
jgi:hypothetical protein